MMDGESKGVLFCEAKIWATVIGWLQVISACVLLLNGIIGLANGMALLAILETVVGLELTDSGLTLDEKLVVVEIVCAVLIIVGIIGLGLGALLLVGIKQSNVRKIKIWWHFQAVGVILQAFHFFRALIQAEERVSVASILGDLVGILINVYFTWVVKVYLTQLQNDQCVNNDCENPSRGRETENIIGAGDGAFSHPVGYGKLINDDII